jgi:hypothetical protein
LLSEEFHENFKEEEKIWSWYEWLICFLFQLILIWPL